MSIVWNDATACSRDEKDRTPRAWSTEVAGYKVWIGTNHVRYPGIWIIQCAPWFKERTLQGIAPADHEAAQRVALRLVREQLVIVQRQIATVLPELEALS